MCLCYIFYTEISKEELFYILFSVNHICFLDIVGIGSTQEHADISNALFCRKILNRFKK